MSFFLQRQSPLGQSPLALPALQAIELIQRKVLPTYGVSFGLPYPSGAQPGGYPSNVIGEHYPAQNPYFGSLGPNGLNLGLVNVNPLVSLQVSKTDYGEKVVKPLVNLHVTPNANIIQKVGDLFKKKPTEVHNTHYHHHDHFSGYEHDHHDYHHDHHDYQDHHDYHEYPHPSAHAFESFGPPSPVEQYSVEMVHSEPIFEYHSGPSYQPAVQHFHHAEHHHHSEDSFDHSYNSIYPGSAPAEFGSSGFGSYGDYSNHYERSVNVSEPEFQPGSRRGKQLNLGPLHNVPAQAPGAAEGSDFVTFPHDRRRRSVDEFELKAEQVTQMGASSRAVRAFS